MYSSDHTRGVTEKGILGGGVPPWPSSPGPVSSFRYPVYDKRPYFMTLIFVSFCIEN